MTQIKISSADGHAVEVDHDGCELAYVIERAQKLFDDTRPPARGPGPAYGFSMERRQQPAWDRAVLGVERLPVRVEEAGNG